VDWCDAQAFCAWAGKELCGDSTTALDDAAESDWYAVCSANGKNSYPYGSSYKGDACNGADATTSAPAAPGTFAGCVADAPGGAVLDLSGNVSEWTGACSQNTEDGACQVRGGSYGSTAQQLACAQAEVIPRKQTAPTRGFRCCHE
jgi:formylglycine-generating enzyme required for sulfatase activity